MNALKSPLDLLLPYQREWVDDSARFKIWCASRQIGKSFTTACEAVRDCYLTPKTLWVVLSAGERQALEWMEKAKQWVDAFHSFLGGKRPTVKNAEIRFPNGARILALPANANTARGYTANIILDEFAIHPDASELWRAMFPSISNPLKGELKLRVMSTPKGIGNEFFTLWSEPNGWSKRQTTIHDAKAGGLNVEIDALRHNAGDAASFQQEFECIFLDGGRTAFSYEMLAKCESPLASTEWQPSQQGGAEPPATYFVGIDIGSLHDPTVCLTFQKIGEQYILRERLVLQGIELSRQDALLDDAISRAARVSIDASGLGLDIAQRLVRKYGSKIIAQPITAKWKRAAFSRLQHRMNEGRILLPPSREIREDFRAYQVSGAGETARFHAPRSDAGHSDTSSATAHAIDAAEQIGTGAWDASTISGAIFGGDSHYLPPRRIFN